jgi:hypothetical protein
MAKVIYQIDPKADTVIVLQSPNVRFAPWSAMETEPAVEEPIVDEVVADEVVADEAVADDSAADTPIEEAAVEEAAVEETAVEEAAVGICCRDTYDRGTCC